MKTKFYFTVLISTILFTGFAQTTITQNKDTETIEPNPYSTCNKSNPENPNFTHTLYTKLSRSFNLESFGITSNFTVTNVAFGATFVKSSSSIFDFVIRLSTSDAPYPNGKLTELYSEKVIILPQESGTLKDFKLTTPVVVPAKSELVMSFERDEDPAKSSWEAISNLKAQTAPTYITAPDCGYSNPTVLRLPFNDFPPIAVIMTITGTSETLGLVEVNSRSLSIYPNPASDVINVSLKQGSPQSIEIITLSGQSVYTSKATNSINTSLLAKGVYILRVKGNNEITYINKFIKK